MAHQGWDTLTIDLQHGVVDYQSMIPMLQAISTTATVPVVRVPWLEPGILMKTLDAGAYGVICPMVNTREDAQNLVAWTHYAPRGTRSFGPVRALLYGGADYPQHANDTIVTLRDDRDRARRSTTSTTSCRSKGSTRSTSGRPTCRSRSAARRSSTTSTRRRPRPSTTSSTRAKAHGVVAGIHNGTPEGALRAHRQGLPVRHRQLRRAADGRRRAAGRRQDARAAPGGRAGRAPY